MPNKRFGLRSILGALSGVLLSFFFVTTTQAQDGEALFKGNCAACHKVDKKMIGPAIKGARAAWAARTGGDAAIIAWVKNSQGYIKESGDAYAANLYAEYNNTLMTPMALTDAEVIAVLDYVDNYVAPAAAAGEAVTESGTESGEADPTFWLIAACIALFIVFRVLWGVNKNLTNLQRQKQGLDPLPEVDFIQWGLNFLKTNKAITVVLIVVGLGYVSVLTWDWLNGVGISQNYQPKQPIWFSHKVHAGQNGINCVYCHNSVEKGKAAGIPSVNICMNCHMGVAEGKVTGTKEIAKIYDAIGWDPDKLAYIPNYAQKPIEWVRIHNLQDFVYFNHSQHVVVGKQECTTCHGPVQEMDEVYQYSELTMGWCIDCHRQTDVAMKDNAYYERIHAGLVEKYKEEGLEAFKVEHIGGLECAKCHY